MNFFPLGLAQKVKYVSPMQAKNIGETLKLTCEFENLGTSRYGWTKVESVDIITVGEQVIMDSNRYFASFDNKTLVSTLEVSILVKFFQTCKKSPTYSFLRSIMSLQKTKELSDVKPNSQKPTWTLK